MLESSQPALDLFKGQRLADSPPYFVPSGDAAVLFLCRFDTETPIRVSLPGDASPSELAAIRLALKGWEGAVLGVRFDESDTERAKVEVRFVSFADGGESGNIGTGTGYTVSSCRHRQKSMSVDAQVGTVPFELVHARVSLRRSNLSMIGEEIPLTDDELVGATLHELGHALGYPGHLAVPDGVMSKSTDTVRRFGRRLRAGDGFASPTLAALYALPNGIAVGSTKLIAGEGKIFSNAVDMAEREGWSDLQVRVGENDALLYWLDSRGRVKPLRVMSYRSALRGGKALRFGDSAFARSLRQRTTVEP